MFAKLTCELILKRNRKKNLDLKWKPENNEMQSIGLQKQFTKIQ